jgi:hypothetical protein
MSSPPPADYRVCTDCGATLPAEANYCWLCGRALQPAATAAPAASPFAGPQPPAAYERRASFQLGTSSLVLVVTLAAVLIGVYLMAPGLGIGLAVLVIPAFLRMYLTAAHKKAQGQPMSPSEKLGLLASTVGIAVGIVIAVISALIVGLFILCISALSSM